MTARSLALALLVTSVGCLSAAVLGTAGCTSGATPDCDGGSVCDPYPEGGFTDGETDARPDGPSGADTGAAPNGGGDSGSPKADTGAGGG